MSSIRQKSRGGRVTLRRVLHEHDDTQRRINLRGEGGLRVRMSNGRLVIGGALIAATRASPWTVSSIDNEASTVTIGGGVTVEHTRPPYIVAQAVVSVAGGTEAAPHYIVLQHTRGVGAEILTMASAVMPVSEPGVFRCALYSVGKVNGRLKVFMQRRFGDIDVQGFV